MNIGVVCDDDDENNDETKDNVHLQSRNIISNSYVQQIKVYCGICNRNLHINQDDLYGKCRICHKVTSIHQICLKIYLGADKKLNIQRSK